MFRNGGYPLEYERAAPLTTTRGPIVTIGVRARESVVSSFGYRETHRALRSAACVSAAFTCPLVVSVTFSSAQAQEVQIGGCVGGWHTSSCTTLWAPAGDPFIRHVPQPTDPTEQALAHDRSRRWADRCRPAIRQDQYGVARYYYALPGCEFGVGEY
jgi:hypothetical protein